MTQGPAVEDEAWGAVGLLDAVGDDAHHHVAAHVETESKVRKRFIMFWLQELNQALSTWGQPGVNPGSTWGQPGVNPGSTRGQPGVNPGSTRGQPGVNLGSTWGQAAPPHHDLVCDQPAGLHHGLRGQPHRAAGTNQTTAVRRVNQSDSRSQAVSQLDSRSQAVNQSDNRISLVQTSPTSEPAATAARSMSPVQ